MLAASLLTAPAAYAASGYMCGSTWSPSPCSGGISYGNQGNIYVGANTNYGTAYTNTSYMPSSYQNYSYPQQYQSSYPTQYQYASYAPTQYQYSSYWQPAAGTLPYSYGIGGYGYSNTPYYGAFSQPAAGTLPYSYGIGGYGYSNTSYYGAGGYDPYGSYSYTY